MIQGVSDREIRMAIDPREAKAIEGIPMIPHGVSLSGCSGAPLVMAVWEFVDGKPCPISYTVIGAIIESGNQGELVGEAAEYVPVIARRIDCCTV